MIEYFCIPRLPSVARVFVIVRLDPEIVVLLSASIDTSISPVTFNVLAGVVVTTVRLNTIFAEKGVATTLLTLNVPFNVTPAELLQLVKVMTPDVAVLEEG